ncbi:MAG: metallophosphoesterase [Bacteroidales bacterium]|nr:metallophosphoesterase [Bacteroidales bacterium]
MNHLMPILFSLLLLAGLGYIGWHIWTLLPFSPVGRWIAVGLALLAFLLLFLNLSPLLDRLPMPLAKASYQVGSSTLFVLLYVLLAFVLLDVGRLVHLVPAGWLRSNGTVALALTLLLSAVFLYGNLHYKHKVRTELPLTTGKSLPRPTRLLMASDLHLGYHNGRRELARWVDLMNAAHPDLILIAGDIVDISTRPLEAEQMAEEWRRLEAPVYACLGNHEYYSGQERVLQFYRQAGICLLRDSVAEVGNLCIVGRDDRSNPNRQPLATLMTQVDTSKYVLLLDHQPYHLEEAEQAGIDFQFSGHTHRGQVWPASWVTDALYECSFGSHRRGQTQYYVSSGLGIWGGKFRIGTQSEYVVATLRPTAESR